MNMPSLSHPVSPSLVSAFSLLMYHPCFLLSRTDYSFISLGPSIFPSLVSDLARIMRLISVILAHPSLACRTTRKTGSEMNEQWEGSERPAASSPPSLARPIITPPGFARCSHCSCQYHASSLRDRRLLLFPRLIHLPSLVSARAHIPCVFPSGPSQ
jgi:hypothetical protein